MTFLSYKLKTAKQKRQRGLTRGPKSPGQHMGKVDLNLGRLALGPVSTAPLCCPYSVTHCTCSHRLS